MTDNKAPRKPTPKDIETDVLTRSRRRCILCYYLNGDLTEKLGQIAHLDDDRTNCSIDNLAWACLEHHSEFDSSTSQHKNYTIQEAKFARAELYKAIADGRHLNHKKGDPKPQAGLAEDTKTLDELISLMASTGTIDWLRDNNFAGFSFDWNHLRGLDTWTQKKGPEHQFIDAELEALRKAFHATATKFLVVLATETFSRGNGCSGIPQEWEYQQPERFDRAVKEIHEGADRVCKGYDALVVAVRRKLTR